MSKIKNIWWTTRVKYRKEYIELLETYKDMIESGEFTDNSAVTILSLGISSPWYIQLYYFLFKKVKKKAEKKVFIQEHFMYNTDPWNAHGYVVPKKEIENPKVKMFRWETKLWKLEMGGYFRLKL